MKDGANIDDPLFEAEADLMRSNLVNRLFRLGNAVQTQTQNLLHQVSDISVLQFRILLRLRNAGEQNVARIAELLGANRSVVSRAIPSMQEAGWLSVRKSDSDHRQSLVSVTPKGLAVCNDHVALTDARIAALNAAFSNEELDQLFNFLERIDIICQRPADSFLSEEQNG